MNLGMQPTLLLLAAGMGSRYGGLKQLDTMGPSGETMIDYAVKDACRAGFAKVVFVIRKDFEEDFRRQIGDKNAGKIDLAYAIQDLHDLPGDHTPPKVARSHGGRHAVRAARNSITEPFAVINADDFYGREAYAQMAEQLQAIGAHSPNQSSETGGNSVPAWSDIPCATPSPLTVWSIAAFVRSMAASCKACKNTLQLARMRTDS